MTNKIPNEYENPIDLLIYKLFQYTNTILREYGFTPNLITTISFMFGLLSIYFYINEQYFTSAIIFFISYIFDCIDGNFARQYKMVTKLGDWYDHLTDYIIIFGIFSVIYYNSNIKSIYKYSGILILLFLLYGLGIHTLYQEKYYNQIKDKNETSMMDLYLTYLFPMNTYDFDKMKITKYFGCGTWYSLLSIYIIGCNYTL